MKTTYRADVWNSTEFDDPISCQIYEKVCDFMDQDGEKSEWHNVIDSDYGFDQTGYTLKDLVEYRHLFKQLMDQIAKAEAEL